MELGSAANWASALIAISAIVFTMLSNRARATKEAVDGLEARVSETERRADRLETAIKHLPDKDAVTELKLAVAELRRDIAVIAESVKPVAAIAARMQEWMLEHSK